MYATLPHPCRDIICRVRMSQTCVYAGEICIYRGLLMSGFWTTVSNTRYPCLQIIDFVFNEVNFAYFLANKFQVSFHANLT